MRNLKLSEIHEVNGGNAKDTTSGTFEGTSSPSANNSGFGAACSAAAAIGGGAVGMAVTGGCIAVTDGVATPACGFLGGAAGTATTNALNNVCNAVVRSGP